MNHGPGGVGHQKKSDDGYYRNHGAYQSHDSVRVRNLLFLRSKTKMK